MQLAPSHELAHPYRGSNPPCLCIWLALGASAPRPGWLRAERRAELIAKGAGLRPGVRVLEIGCGTGMFTEMFARTGAQIVAVEISEALLEKARARHLPAA